MRQFFYIRVSSRDQSVERQLDSAKELGISEDYIFIEKASGKDFNRPKKFSIDELLNQFPFCDMLCNFFR